MNEQKTIADIIAEKRRMAEHIRNNLSTVSVRQWDQQAEIKSLEDEANRLEAALKREMRGDCAKLREALKTAKRYLDGYTVNVLKMRRQVNSALSAPSRNCDVGTAEEQSKRFKFSKCDEPPKCRPWDECCLTCFAKWAQMPYEEGGDK